MTYETNGNVVRLFRENQVEHIGTEVIELPTEKREPRGKKRGQKSEVFAYDPADMAKVIAFFAEKNMWIHYLLFTIQVNSARRVGDLIGYVNKDTGKKVDGLRWEDFIDPKTARVRSEIKSFAEQKTGKLASPMINSAMIAAINLYCEKTHCHPSDNEYKNPVFMQLCGTHRGKVLSYSGAMYALKMAAKECGIEYNVGTHSARKTFGATTKMLHPGDANVMEALQSIYNHSSSSITNRYIGLEKKQTDGYANDMGEFFQEYVVEGKEIPLELGSPVLSVDTEKLFDLIGAAFQAGKNSDGTNDAALMMNLMKQVEKIRR